MTTPQPTVNTTSTPRGSISHQTPSSPYPSTFSSPSVEQREQKAEMAEADKIGGKGQRLIVVSNRLPVTISKDANGEYHFKVSALLRLTCYLEHLSAFPWLGEWTEEDSVTGRGCRNSSITLPGNNVSRTMTLSSSGVRNP